MSNKETFKNQMTKEYKVLFDTDPDYEFAAKRNTPDDLAEIMTNALSAGTGSKDGKAIKATCKALGIKHTYVSISLFLNYDEEE